MEDIREKNKEVKSTVDMTKPSDEIIAVVEKFSENKYQAIGESMLWIKKNLEEIPFDIEKFRKRNAGEILNSRQVTGCTDRALVFLSFMRALNLESTFLETVKKESFDNIEEIEEANDISGHVFVRVKLGNTFAIIDPTLGQILLDEELPSKSLLQNSIVIGEGRDFNEIGTSTEREIIEKAKEYRQRELSG